MPVLVLSIKEIILFVWQGFSLRIFLVVIFIIKPEK